MSAIPAAASSKLNERQLSGSRRGELNGRE
jgi:hypothetical protein